MVKITKFNLYLGVALFFVLFNLSQFISGENNIVRLLISSLYVFYIPGYLLTSIIGMDRIGLTEKIPIRIGLSIFILYVTGLLVNWVVPLFNIDRPLQEMYTTVGFGMINIVLLLTAYLRDTTTEKRAILYPFTIYTYLYSAFSFLLPLISILGAIYLNNNQSNMITFGALGYIGFYLFCIVFLKERAVTPFIVWSLVMTGTATLFMLSMRSFYIAGFDISQEYLVFQLTKTSQVWNFSTFGNAYNACLSITILPTLISYFTNLTDQFIYKFIYPSLFAFTPVCIFFIGLRMTKSKVIAFLSAAFFISQVWFVDPMVTLARQEIALLFFSLIVLILFNKDIPVMKKHVLLMIFGVCLVVSHYSTTYITLLLLTATYICALLFRLLFSVKARQMRFYLTPFYVLFLFFTAFVWYTQVTRTASNIGDFLNKTVESVKSASTTNSKSTIVEQVLKGSVKIDEHTYRAFYEQKLKEYEKRKDLDRYNSDTYKNFTLTPKAALTLPIKNAALYQIANLAYRAVILLIQVFFAAGLITLVFVKTDLISRNKIEYSLFIVYGAGLLVCMVAIPYVSQAYNFDRMYMQIMIFSSPIVIVGGLALCRRILGQNLNIGIGIVTLIIVLTYWYSYGFIWQITGGKTVVWLNNFGFYYDIGYTHTTDVEAARWLARRYDFKPVYSYATGRNILWAYARIDNVIGDVLPLAFDKYSYVFATHANVVHKINYFYYRGSHLGYEFPWEFLNANKNKIYTNGRSEIYQ